MYCATKKTHKLCHTKYKQINTPLKENHTQIYYIINILYKYIDIG